VLFEDTENSFVVEFFDLWIQVDVIVWKLQQFFHSIDDVLCVPLFLNKLTWIVENQLIVEYVKRFTHQNDVHVFFRNLFPSIVEKSYDFFLVEVIHVEVQFEYAGHFNFSVYREFEFSRVWREFVDFLGFRDVQVEYFAVENALGEGIVVVLVFVEHVRNFVVEQLSFSGLTVCYVLLFGVEVMHLVDQIALHFLLHV